MALIVRSRWSRSWQAVRAGALALGLVGALAMAAAPAGAGEGLPAPRRGGDLSARSVPWQKVGSGWVLAMYWPGRYAPSAQAAASTLYLFSPGGERYRLHHWTTTKIPGELIDWSGDKQRALIETGTGTLEQLQLATGKILRIRLPRQSLPFAYTRPAGHGLLASREQGPRHQLELARYTLHGQL